MAVTIKSQHEIELMRKAGDILATVHDELAKLIEPGITSYELDKHAYKLIKDFGCIPSFLNYNGYPASLCVSINDEVVHGIPNKKRVLHEGDIVSLDSVIDSSLNTLFVSSDSLLDLHKQSLDEEAYDNLMHQIAEDQKDSVDKINTQMDYYDHTVREQLDEEFKDYNPLLMA